MVMNVNEQLLISFVTSLTGSRMLTTNEVMDFNELVKAAMPEYQPNGVNGPAIARMFQAMKDGRKIDAIREHRSMTGYGLKESKDEIEKYFPSQKGE